MYIIRPTLHFLVWKLRRSPSGDLGSHWNVPTTKPPEFHTRIQSRSFQATTRLLPFVRGEQLRTPDRQSRCHLLAEVTIPRLSQVLASTTLPGPAVPTVRPTQACRASPTSISENLISTIPHKSIMSSTLSHLTMKTTPSCDSGPGRNVEPCGSKKMPVTRSYMPIQPSLSRRAGTRSRTSSPAS